MNYNKKGLRRLLDLILESKIKNLNRIHQKKRRLARLEAHLKQLESDKATGRARICFGSKKLFNAQFDVQSANGYKKASSFV